MVLSAISMTVLGVCKTKENISIEDIIYYFDRTFLGLGFERIKAEEDGNVFVMCYSSRAGPILARYGRNGKLKLEGREFLGTVDLSHLSKNYREKMTEYLSSKTYYKVYRREKKM